jgi:1,2-phenylacetyl-CoA epoxidase catalytic subunit
MVPRTLLLLFYPTHSVDKKKIKEKKNLHATVSASLRKSFLKKKKNKMKALTLCKSQQSCRKKKKKKNYATSNH